MRARIFKPAKTAMQSGKAKSSHWVLEFVNEGSRRPDPLMGWISTDATSSQVRITFETRDDAIAYAKREGMTFSVEDPRPAKRLVKSYSANFASDRKQSWTH
ncbi:ETC complex I subunit [Ponticaulis sp.]|uniref:ETC complex I subunit n=1 Tax=Ponticaulis sp. TaxID=2020902 RepID=UPI000B62D866|nr:ETC complex I subunit [Ponticaulis sp.]MAI89368.1 ETC complex I subunit [Ponticaulis sp.]OUY00409.1 MAG: ETC complex I subunit [Hyphomonadaceae bacterium TMED5]|tara:strand:+ start:5041 stop:5346 length:306 start_codon:yes stop_codon:yes gene_type:complete